MTAEELVSENIFYFVLGLTVKAFIENTRELNTYVK